MSSFHTPHPTPRMYSLCSLRPTPCRRRLLSLALDQLTSQLEDTRASLKRAERRATATADIRRRDAEAAAAAASALSTHLEATTTAAVAAAFAEGVGDDGEGGGGTGAAEEQEQHDSTATFVDLSGRWCGNEVRSFGIISRCILGRVLLLPSFHLHVFLVFGRLWCRHGPVPFCVLLFACCFCLLSLVFCLVVSFLLSFVLCLRICRVSPKRRRG